MQAENVNQCIFYNFYQNIHSVVSIKIGVFSVILWWIMWESPCIKSFLGLFDLFLSGKLLSEKTYRQQLTNYVLVFFYKKHFSEPSVDIINRLKTAG